MREIDGSHASQRFTWNNKARLDEAHGLFSQQWYGGTLRIVPVRMMSLASRGA
jgi:hypothetical protein